MNTQPASSKNDTWSGIFFILVTVVIAAFCLCLLYGIFAFFGKVSQIHDRADFHAAIGLSLPETPEDTEKIRPEILKRLSQLHKEVNNPAEAFWKAMDQRDSVKGTSPEAIAEAIKFQHIMDTKRSQNHQAYYRFQDFTETLERLTGESFQKEIDHVGRTVDYISYRSN